VLKRSAKVQQKTEKLRCTVKLISADSDGTELDILAIEYNLLRKVDKSNE